MVCGKDLRWYELVPIASFLIQHGRCRECHSKISEQYVLVETATAVLFTLAGMFLWSGGYEAVSLLSLVLILLILSVFVSIFAYDYLHQIIPDSFVVTLILAGFALVGIDVFMLGADAALFGVALLSGLTLFIPFFALWFFSKGKWIGLGDGKLAFAIGVIMPFPSALSAIVLAFWIGAAFGIVYMYISKIRKTHASRAIAFGPFMVIGALIALFYPIDLFNIVIVSEYVRTLL